MLLLPLWGGVSFSQSVHIPGGGGTPSHMGGPHSMLELGGGGCNIIPGCFLRSQWEWLWECNIFSQSVDIPGGGGGVGPHPMWGGPHSMLELGEGEGVVTLSQVAFYGLNRNGYRNVIFSVSLLTSQVGVGVGPHPMWGGTPSLVHEGVFFDMRWAVSLFGSRRWTLLSKYVTFLYLLYLEVFLEVQ